MINIDFTTCGPVCVYCLKHYRIMRPSQWAALSIARPLSVCLSVHPSSACDFVETGKLQKFLISGDMTLDKSNYGSEFEVKGHWERKCKNHFQCLSLSKWIDLCQTNAKIISSIFYTYCKIHFISINAFVFINNLHCVPKKHVTTFSTITLTVSVRLQ